MYDYLLLINMDINFRVTLDVIIQESNIDFFIRQNYEKGDQSRKSH